MEDYAQKKDIVESDGGVMNLFDIIGPVMVGPSSSHTAGAVRIGNVARKLVGSDIKVAKIYFHGSFQLTGKGHGTDKALLAGLMGMPVDDARIPRSYAEADIREMAYAFFPIDFFRHRVLRDRLRRTALMAQRTWMTRLPPIEAAIRLKRRRRLLNRTYDHP